MLCRPRTNRLAYWHNLAESGVGYRRGLSPYLGWMRVAS